MKLPDINKLPLWVHGVVALVVSLEGFLLANTLITYLGGALTVYWAVDLKEKYGKLDL